MLEEKPINTVVGFVCLCLSGVRHKRAFVILTFLVWLVPAYCAWGLAHQSLVFIFYSLPVPSGKSLPGIHRLQRSFQDSKDEGNETEGSRMRKLRRTRKKVTQSHISSTEIGEMDMPNSKERIKGQMVCHKLGDMSKPVVGPGPDESHPQDDEDSQDHTAEMKPSPLTTSASAPGSEFNPESSCTDGTGDSTQIPKVPQLSSRMKHIKQEMAKNHLQFMRFKVTDLHGVSMSKNIPACTLLSGKSGPRRRSHAPRLPGVAATQSQGQRSGSPQSHVLSQ